MSLPVDLSNHFRHQLGKKNIDLETDSFFCCLMISEFVFDRDTHQAYGDVSAHEVPAGNGYITGGQALVGTYSQDNDADRAILDFAPFTWTASGGDIANIGGILVYDVTASNKIAFFGSFGGAVLVPEGLSLDITGVGLEL